MQRWIHRLASLKLTVGLLVAILVVLAAGTIVEAQQGTEAAARTVYHSFWFRCLLIAFGVNLIFSIYERWPPGRFQIGFLLTHGALVVILLGALVTDQLKIEGQLALWEGEQSNLFATQGGEGQRELPFSVRLDDFQIDTYPGTHRPAMFRSLVTVVDPAAGGSFPAVIEMNRELSYRGYKLFQSSFQQAGGRQMTVLSVSHDPGQPVVFFGYFLLLGGMVTVLGTRIVQHRARARHRAVRPAGVPARAPALPAGARGMARSGKVALVLLPLALAASAPASAAWLPDAASVASLRSLPIQHDGRVMPLDTMAREAVWQVTGARGDFRGIDPVALVLGWSFDPDRWSGEPVVRVGRPELAKLAGLAPGTGHASFRALLSSPPLRELLDRARGKAQRDEPMSPLEQEAQKLEGRLLWLQGFLTRDALAAVAVPGDPQAAWTVPAGLSSPDGLEAARREQRQGGVAGYPAEAAMVREVTYNRAQPARLAWWILVPSTLLAILSYARPRRWLDVLAVVGLVAGFAVMSWGLALRWQIAGRIPASNMYESMLFLGWGVGLFALLAAAVLRNRLVILNASAMAALAMVLVDRLPIDPFLHPMPPVLSGTPWLAIHVPIIMVSYSVLALGVVVAHMQVGLEIFAPARREAAARMNDLLYWYLHAGAILLVAGILTGSIWAASSWGRYWGWDPKEVWSLIAFLAYMGILHGRFDRVLGTFGVAAFSIIAFQAILMTYLGVNFVLTSGLHSYGFGGGAVVRWMLLVALLEAAFLTAGYLAHRRNAGGGPARPRLAQA